jgi:hypothetical protein
VVFLVWLCAGCFISLVCYSIIQGWSLFSWLLVAFLPLGTSLCYLASYHTRHKKNNTVDRKAPPTTKILAIVFVILHVFVLFIASVLAAGGIEAVIAASFSAPGRSFSVFFDGAQSQQKSSSLLHWNHKCFSANYISLC